MRSERSSRSHTSQKEHWCLHWMTWEASGGLSADKWHDLTFFLTGSLCLTSWEQTEVEKSQKHREQSGTIPKKSRRGMMVTWTERESWGCENQSVLVHFTVTDSWICQISDVGYKRKTSYVRVKERKRLESEQLQRMVLSKQGERSLPWELDLEGTLKTPDSDTLS